MIKSHKLVSDNLVTVPAQLALSLFLRLSQLRIPRLNLENRGFTNFIPKVITFLNHKVASITDFLAVVPLHSLFKRKAVFSNTTMYTSARCGKPPGSIAKPHGFSVA